MNRKKQELKTDEKNCLKTANTKKEIKRLKIAANILLSITAIIFTGYIYIKKNYNLTSYDQVLLTLQLGTEGTGTSVIKDIILKNIIILPATFFLVFYIKIISTKIAKFKFEEKKGDAVTEKDIEEADQEFNTSIKRINIFNIGLGVIGVIAGIILVLSSLKINLNFLISLKGQTTKIYDEKYVNPREDILSFDGNKKKNLIFIVSESLEASTFSKANGGQFEKSVTPELEKLAKENINFSHTDKLGGFKMSPGATLTTGALVALNSGVSPIINFDKFLEKEEQDKYMPGAYTIAQFLEKEGYNNSFILGSNANFGKRKLFYETHGVTDIVDLHGAKVRGYLPKDYFDGWWGYEDHHLFRIAKEEITKKAKEDKPFFTTILTVDTHFPDGILPEGYPREYEEQYLDVYRNQSKMIYEFINWLKEQDYYKDTVVVVTGDHLTMKFGFFGDGDRFVYNVIINSDKDKEKINMRNRGFVTTDMTPTILSAIGVNIKGDRFGMGTNLFSDKKTYTEEMGYEKYNVELQKISQYYNENIAQDFDPDILNIEEKLKKNYDYDYINEHHNNLEEKPQL